MTFSRQSIKTATDIEYEVARDKLIPQAKNFADRTIGRNIKGELHISKWNKAFHSEMNRLWKEIENESQT